MLLENISKADDLLDAMDAAMKPAGKRKHADDIFVRPYVSFHSAHWRRRVHPRKSAKVIPLRRRA